MARSWKNLLVYYFHDRSIRECAGSYLHGRMIDIGCGTKPYQRMLSAFVNEHVGLDREDPFNPRARPDLVGTAYDIPAESGQFDCALSTAALEHLAEPEEALRECYRVLKPGGYAVYTIPFIWHTHAVPYDFYRFTSFGLEHIFRKCGFEVIEVRPLAGYWVTAVTLFNYYIGRLHRGPMKFLPVLPLMALMLQGMAFVLQSIDRAEQWTWMYRVIARKP